MKKEELKLVFRKALLFSCPLALNAVSAPAALSKSIPGEKKFTNKTLRVGKHLISYNISQLMHKKTIILQHGAFMNKITMMGLAALFRGYNVIVPDMAGHGQSESPYPIETVDELADIEYNFINLLKEKGEILPDADITYAGWSLGGSIGQVMSLKKKCYDRLVLISSSPVWNTIPLIPEDKFYETFKNMFFETTSPYISKERKKWNYKNYDSMLSKINISENDITALKAFDLSDKLKDIDMPTLIVCGSSDSLCLPEEETKLVGRIKNSRLVMIHGETHAMVIDNPEIVYSAIVSFINRKTNV